MAAQIASSFAALLSDLARIGGIDFADPVCDESGAAGVSFELDGATVELLYAPGEGERLFSRVMSLGLDDSDEWSDASADGFWEALLASNIELACSDGPIAARDPSTGMVVYQQSWPREAMAQDLLPSLGALAALVSGWRQGLAPQPLPVARHAHRATPGFQDSALTRQSQTWFETLCTELHEMYGAMDMMFAASPDGAALIGLWHEETEFQIVRLPGDPLRLHVFGLIGPSGSGSRMAAADLAELNTWLLAEPHGAIVCNRVATQEYVLHTAFPLRSHGCAQAFAGLLHSQAGAIASIHARLCAHVHPA